MVMAAKRPPGFHDQATAGPSTKNKKLYYHFKSAWIGQQFTVTVGGAEKVHVASCELLSDIDGADNTKSKTPFKSMYSMSQHNFIATCCCFIIVL